MASETVASTAEELSAQAEQLRSTMQFFNMKDTAMSPQWKGNPADSTVYSESRSLETSSRSRSERPHPQNESNEKQLSDQDNSGRLLEMQPRNVEPDERDDEFEKF